ncbi:MAG TPA: hypothetical protein VGS23_06650, partial [Thermoplasmata archaeon]|nr:hypothetical protein [Thermoplasmata archaeon]
GLFLTEAEADLFGGGSSGWDVHGFASAQASTSAVDMVADGSAHTADLAAASTSTGLGSNSVGAATLQSSGGLTLQPQTPPSANESVQDQPESPQSAQQASQCLVSGCSASGASLGLSGLVLAGIAAAVVVALVGAVLVLVLRRPRRPSGPAGPNPGS